MKKSNVVYWVTTGLFGALMLLSAIPSIIGAQMSVTLIHAHLGYPEYFIPFTGIAKLLGAVAMLVPGFPRIKEWAYAGLAYDLIAATYSMIAVGDPPGKWLFMVIWILLLAVSYVFFQRTRDDASAVASAL